MILTLWNGIGSLILRVIIRDSTLTNNGGKTGLTFSSSGLVIGTIADNESSATTYTQVGSTIETISTLGTFAAPTATKCRFKEVDSTNHPGLYEIQIANARWAVSGARYVVVTISGVSGATQENYLVQLPTVNVSDGTNSATPAVPNAQAGATGGLSIVGSAMTLTSAYDFAKGTVAVTESYATLGAAPTPVQALCWIQQMLTERSVASTTLTVKKVDGSTSAGTCTLNSSTAPTSQTRAT